MLAMIDARLAESRPTAGTTTDMPAGRRRPGGDTLAALDDDAARPYGRGFADCPADQQAALDPGGPGPRRRRRGTACRPTRVWSLWTRYACTAFYSHPWAWNEIGFAGPAYPRGYKNLGVDAREPCEVADDAARPGADETARTTHGTPRLELR